MKIARIPLQAHSRFHFGELKLDDNLALSTTSCFAHSDTLFSALVHGYSAYAGNAQPLIDDFENGELKISSLFYYLKKNEQYIYFLPKPSFLAIDSKKKADGSHKKLNRIDFVSLGVWTEGFQADNWFDSGQQQYMVIDKKLVITRAEYQRLGLTKAEIRNIKVYKTVMTPKSPIRSNDKKASIFYQADIQIDYPNVAPENNPTEESPFEVGWYFMYNAAGNAEAQLQIATNVMAYTGIGGEKYNTGRTVKGDPQFDTIDIDLKQPTDQYSNLALLIPKSADDFRAVEYYQTFLRGGRKLPGNNYTRVVRMIREGALINKAAIEGQLPQIGTDEFDRSIYRNGIPLLIPIKVITPDYASQ